MPRFLIVCLLALGMGNGAMTLTAVPAGMRKQNVDITVGWTGGAGRVHLRASTISGGGTAPISHYDSLHLPSQPDAAFYTFRINPDIPVLYRNTDLRLGVNYCIATDGVSRSAEFVILVESNSAPVLTTPANAASIKDLAPTFSWSGSAPFYAVLVSDEPFKISDSGTVTGVSAVWQIITPYTSARYGDADPSGINTVSAPPLISGKTYNWLVLNNYGNNSASTSKVAPVPFSFVYSPSAPLPSPLLLAPKDRDTIPGLDQILFRWSLVDGAVSYKLELLEEILVDGSQADITLWKATSTGGQILLDNATGLLRRYTYKWRVYAVGSNGAASLSLKRSFFYAVDVGNITVNLKNQAGQKIAYAPIKLNRLGGSSSSVFQGGSTDETGALVVNNAPLGSYEARIENLAGYGPKIDTVVHKAKTGTSKTVVLSPVLGTILGKISVSGSGTGILNAKVTVSGTDGSQWSTVTNSQGNYTLGVPYGNWQVVAQCAGYLTSTPASVSLNSGTSSNSINLTLVANKYTLSGTVTNSFSHQGIFGAMVYLTVNGDTRSANTDGNGSYAFSVPTGVVSLRVSSPGFAAPQVSYITIDGDKSLNLSLDPNASILSGRARNQSGTGLSGVIIQATPKAGAVRSILSDNQGYYELSLPAGDWLLTSASKGYSSLTSHRFLLEISKTVQGVDFSLQANGSFLAGRATVDGAGLAGMTITGGDATTLTDNSGYYLLSVNAGNLLVKGGKEGFLVTKTYTVPVNPGDTVAHIDFAATANAGVIKGRVLAGGVGVVNAQVKSVNQGTREIFLQTTDATGAFVLSLPGGNHLISASKEGLLLDLPLSFSLSPGGTILDANLRMLPNQGGISGSVTTGNTSLSGCEVVYASQSSGNLAGKTVTDPQGRYSLSLQAGSRYSLSVNCPGYLSEASVSDSLVLGNSLTVNFNMAKAGAIYRGRLVDARGSLQTVRITAEKSGVVVSTASDFDGNYSLSLGAGTYTINYAKSGYRNLTRQVQLSLGDNAALTDTLVVSVGKVAGQIKSNGLPVSGALVTLSGLSPEAGNAAFRTDADGRFSGEGVASGNYSASVSATGFTDGNIPSLTINAGQLTNLELALTANLGMLSGTVKSAGVGLAGISVAANAYGISKSNLTAADGTFRIEGLPAGLYAVSAGLAGYSADKEWTGQTLANGGALAGLDFVLTKNTGSLTGTAVGAAILQGIQISLVGKNGFRAYATCDGSGKYAFPSLPPDDYTVALVAPGYKLSGSSQNPLVSINGAQQFNPTLVSAVFRLSGKILNQEGEAIQGLPVELGTSRDLYRTTSALDGFYEFSGVPAGDEYTLTCKPPTADYDAKDTAFAWGLEAPAQLSLDLHTLSRQAGLSGTILLDEVPVEGAVIRATGNGNNLADLSQPKGLFKLSGVAGSNASLSLSVSKAGSNTFDTALIVNTGVQKSGLVLKLKTVKITLTINLKSSEGRVLDGAKIVIASGNKLDTLATSAEGKISVAGISGNQSLTLATQLNQADYDNLELPVFLREADTSLAIVAKSHASTIIAQVKDQDGNALDGAEVILNGKSLGLTLSGKIQVKGLGRGEYRLAAGKPGYKSPTEALLSLSGDTAVTENLVLTKIVGGLYGSVSDSGLARSFGGVATRTLPGAVVVLTSNLDTLRDTVNSLGQYFLNGMVEGRSYSLALTLPGYLPVSEPFTASASPQNRDLVLKPIQGGILGKVENGRSEAMVQLIHSASGQIKTVPTTLGGYFAFLGLQNHSDYTVQAVDGGQSSPAISFQADGAVTARIDYVLDHWGSVAGLALTGSGTDQVPISGALITARNQLTGVSTLASTDSQGKYSLVGLPSGKYDISADRLGYGKTRTPTISVVKGVELKNVDLILDAVQSGISGMVFDSAGQSVAAVVTLAGETDTLRSLTDGGGRFVFGGLGAGTFKVSAAAAGFISPAAKSISYSGSGLRSLDLVLAQSKNLLTGTVRDAFTNLPVAGALVLLSDSPADSATCDSSGRYSLGLPPFSSSPVKMDLTMDGYVSRANLPVYLDQNGSALQDLVLTADYKFDGQINVLVKEGMDTLPGLFVTVQPFHPDDSLMFSLTGKVENSFRGLRWPAPYTVRVKRNGFKDLVKVVDLTAKETALHLVLDYPTSLLRLFVTSDGSHGKGVELSLNGQALKEDADTAGLYSGTGKMVPGRYEVTLKDPQANLIPMAPYAVDLGEDSSRIDTLTAAFYSVPVADSTLGSSFQIKVLRKDSVLPAEGVECNLIYRLAGDPNWTTLALDSVAGGFSGEFPAQDRVGKYQYYHQLTSPQGARIGIVTPSGTLIDKAPVVYTDEQSPGEFSLRDPLLLNSVALLPQRLEADTSLYSLGAKDLFQVQLRGEDGRSLDEYFDGKFAKADSGFSVEWAFTNPALAKQFGLALTPNSASPRMCVFHGGNLPADSAFTVTCEVRMGPVTLSRRFPILIQDLWPVSIGIKYVKENRELEANGAGLSLPNQGASGYLFSAFAKTKEGRVFNISPRWSFGADSAIGSLTQQGLFSPDTAVARNATLRIYDTLAIGLTNIGETIRGAFEFQANLITYAQVVPAAEGRSLVTNGEGTFLDFNLAGLTKAFTVSVGKPKVSGLLRSSPSDEVVGDILDIDLSESQPFKADSGAVLKMPVSEGIARRAWVYLGHWNSRRLTWEKVDSVKSAESVQGRVYSFSKYAVIMGSLPLGAYDFTFTPNPFSAEDPWGLQLSYKVSSDVSSQVGVRVEVYNMMGDKVYESHETQLSKGDVVRPGLKKAGLKSSDRRDALGPYVWDGHDSKGIPCRNGRYLIKLIVKDGQGSKTYLKKVVMLK